jgi:hypothetical protein
MQRNAARGGSAHLPAGNQGLGHRPRCAVRPTGRRESGGSSAMHRASLICRLTWWWSLAGSFVRRRGEMRPVSARIQRWAGRVQGQEGVGCGLACRRPGMTVMGSLARNARPARATRRLLPPATPLPELAPPAGGRQAPPHHQATSCAPSRSAPDTNAVRKGASLKSARTSTAAAPGAATVPRRAVRCVRGASGSVGRVRYGSRSCGGTGGAEAVQVGRRVDQQAGHKTGAVAVGSAAWHAPAAASAQWQLGRRHGMVPPAALRLASGA